MELEDSVSVWLSAFKEEDPEAVQKVWERYHVRLLAVARSVLNSMPGGFADPEDVVQSAFKSFYFRAVDGRFPRLDDRDDLWKLLMTITNRKALQVRRREKRKRELDTDAYGLEDPDIGPELAMMLTQEFDRLLRMLDDDIQRSIALAKLEGFTNPEIARKLERSLSFVERRLRLIRAIWADELPESMDGPLQV